MSKRIKELDEQAGITTNLNTEYFEKDMNKWVEYFSEKFAELIVRECASTCYNTFDNGDQIALVLLNTFGVTPDE
jgi:hypothetical protein